MRGFGVNALDVAFLGLERIPHASAHVSRF